MSPAIGYVICAAVFAFVGATLYHILRVRPMQEEHERERRRLKERLAAVAGEQLMLRRWGPLSQRTPTIRG